MYIYVCGGKLTREMKAEASLTMELLKLTHTHDFFYITKCKIKTNFLAFGDVNLLLVSRTTRVCRTIRAG